MQKVILDTNVLVSALIQLNYPHFILMHVYFERMIELCVSEQLIEEYFDVLAREKFLKFTDFRTKADKVLSDIEINGSFFVPTKKVRKIKDEDDNMLLELALE